MPKIHAGSAGFARPRPRYAQKLRFVEIDLRPPLPSGKTVDKWRQDLPEDFVFAVVAQPQLWGERDWPLRDEKATAGEFDKLKAVVARLRAHVVVLRTPSAVSPNSAALRRFLPVAERARALAPVCVWDPQGVWEREAAQAVASPLGMLVACDPLRDEIAGEKVVYARMRGLGSDRRYHEGRLEDLLEALGEAEEAYVVFETPTGFGEAGKLLRLAAGAQAAGAADDEGEDAADEDDDDEGEEGEEDGEEGEEGEDEDFDEGDEDFDEGDEDGDEGDEDGDEDDEDGDEGDEDGDEGDEAPAGKPPGASGRSPGKGNGNAGSRKHRG
jgi:uncharacterized protein YecE (DUF72 family)